MSGESVAIKVRRVRFNVRQSTPLHYLRDNIFSTHFVNSLHIIFPVGEDFFVKSAKRILSRIKDEQLLQQAQAFIGQEAVHSREHNKFWQVLRDQGFSIDRYAEIVRKISVDVLERGYTKILGNEKAEVLSLAITAALEHYTAMLGEVVFEQESNWEQLPEEMRLLLEWHAAEELEHKAVAFDMFTAVDDNYLTRSLAMLIATTLLFSYSAAGMGMFIVQDKEKNWKKMPADALDFLRTIGHPSFQKFVRQWSLFFRKDFHPGQIDNYHYAEEFFAKNKRYFEEMGSKT